VNRDPMMPWSLPLQRGGFVREPENLLGPLAAQGALVVMRTEIEEETIIYMVLVERDQQERTFWSCVVTLARSGRRRPGGPACQAAAREQQEVADAVAAWVRRS